MRRGPILLATLVVLAAVVALVITRSVTSVNRAPAGVAAPRVSWMTPARPHPHGLEADEVTSLPALTSWSDRAPMWTGAGRHPMWRGCQHRFDPALASFIFGSASPTG